MSNFSYIAYLDLLGTRGFCEEEDVYYNNIKKFSQTVERLSPILKKDGKIGIFSDSVYIECSKLKKIIDFLTELRLMLICDELFFNAAISCGELGVESIGSEEDTNNIFGVRFTNREIASIYCKQTNFRGVGIWVDKNVIDKMDKSKDIEVTESIYYSKDRNNNTFCPKCYYDIPLFNKMDDEYSTEEKIKILSIIFKTVYSSYCKSIDYSSYYISLLINIIRSCDIKELKWNENKQKFDNMQIEFKLIYNFLLQCNNDIKDLLGLDCICLAFLDKVYQSPMISPYDQANITKKFTDNFLCLKEYKYSLENILKEPFTQQNRIKFINYCNKDMARQFVDNILNGGCDN